MTRGTPGGLAPFLKRQTLDELPLVSDRTLLEKYVAASDHEAFRTLVERHTSMVLGACQRVLRNRADAEDACQAVFLVLARKARTTAWQASVANWLYSTARKVATNARRQGHRRDHRERRAARPEAMMPHDELGRREWLTILDEELERLPSHYRAPLVLCYLEGWTRDEAAAQLEVNVLTLKSQLERGRKKLAHALTARGCTLGSILMVLVADATAGAAPWNLVESIMAEVEGKASTTTTALANGVLRPRFFLSLRGALCLGMTLVAMGLAYTTWPNEPSAAPPAPLVAAVKTEPALPAEDELERVFTYAGRVLDPEGKPLRGAKIHYCGLNRGTIEFVERTQSNADGTFRFQVRREEFHGRTDREPGRFVWVGATAPGCGPAAHFANNPKDREKLTLWLSPEQVVTARVVDLEGKPIAGVRVGASIKYARAANDFRPIAFDAPEEAGHWTSNVMPQEAKQGEGVTDREGRCTLRGLGKDWLYYLSLTGSNIVHCQAQLVTRAVPAARVPGTGLSDGTKPPQILQYGADFVHVAEPAKAIVGILRDRTSGLPIAGARIGKPWIRDGEAHNWTQTDKNGRFQLEGLPRGKHKLTIEPESPYLRTEYEANADGPGTEPFPCVIELDAKVVIRGRVVDRETGAPVRGRVRYFPFADNPELRQAPLLAQPRWPQRTLEVELDADGRYQLPALGGRGLVFVATQQPYRHAVLAAEDRRPGVVDATDPELFDTRPLPTWAAEVNAYRILDIPREKSITCDLTVDPGRRRPLTVVDPEGKPVASRVLGLTPRSDQSQELATGQGTVQALAPGEKRILYVLAREKSLAGSFLVTGDTTDGVTVRLQPTGVLTGQVLDAEGKPIVGESLQVAYNAMGDRPGIFLEGSFMLPLLSKADEVRLRRLRGYSDRRPDVGAEKTDTQGRFRIPGILPQLPITLKIQRTQAVPDRPGTRIIVGLVTVAQTTIQAGETKDLGTLRPATGVSPGEKKPPQ